MSILNGAPLDTLSILFGNIFSGTLNLPTGYTASIVSNPTSGAFTLNSDGSYSFDSTQNFGASSSTITYAITDDNDVTVEYELEINILSYEAVQSSEVVIPHTFTSNWQAEPHIITLKDGGYLVTWSSEGQQETVSTWENIYARRYDAQGNVVALEGSTTVEALVNNSTSNSQNESFTVALNDGGFGVFYRSFLGSTLGDIYYTRYDANGDVVSGAEEILINGSTSNRQRWPEAELLPDGNIFVVWQSSNNSNDTDIDIVGKIIDADGTQVETDFTINQTGSVISSEPSITTLQNGNIVVVWASDSGDDVKGRIYSYNETTETSSPSTSEFSVNLDATGITKWDEFEPTVVASADGGFAVVYTSKNTSYTNDSSEEIIFRQFDASGVALNTNDATVVNSQLVGEQQNPTMIALSQGGYLVSWYSSNSDNSTLTLMARTIYENGDLGREYVISELEPSGTSAPYNRVEMTQLDNGNVVFAYSATQGNEYDIRTQTLSFDLVDTELTTEPEQPHDNNTVRDQDQHIVALSDGGYLVTWTSQDHGENHNVYARRFDANGNPVAQDDYNGNSSSTQPVALTNATGADNLMDSHNIILGNGDYVTIFRGDLVDIHPSDLDNDLYFTRFNSDGQIVSEYKNILIEKNGKANIRPDATIIKDANGDEKIFVVWQKTLEGDTGDVNSFARAEIMGMVFDPGSTTQNNTPFQISDSVTSGQERDYSPSTTTLSDGNVVVAWINESGANIQGRIYDPLTGNAVAGSDFLIEVDLQDTTIVDMDETWEEIDIAPTESGGFILVYTTKNSTINSVGRDVIFHEFDNTGQPVNGSNGQVLHSSQSGEQYAASILALDLGGYLVTWYSRDDSGQNPTLTLYGRKVDVGGQFGEEFIIQELIVDNDLDSTYFTTRDTVQMAQLNNGDVIISYTEAGESEGDYDIKTKRLSFTPTNNTIVGTDGDDIFVGGVADEFFDGKDGNDLFVGGDGNDTALLSGNAADASFSLLANGNFLVDTSSGQKEISEIEELQFDDITLKVITNDGTDADEVFIGTNGIDSTIVGYGGIDLMFGLDGNDVLYGGAGNDIIYGGEGDDTIQGNADSDDIYGGAGNDDINAGSSDDAITGGAGDDALNGGSHTTGDTAIYLGSSTEAVFSAENGTLSISTAEDGSDTLFAIETVHFEEDDRLLNITSGTGGTGDDLIVGDSGANLTLEGGDGNDIVVGGEGNDILAGNSGDDLLIGESGDDTQTGGEGNDILIGGSGNNTLVGGEDTGNQDVDTAVISSNVLAASYSLSTVGNLVITTASSQDEIQEIEKLQFNDISLDVITNDGTNSAEFFIGSNNADATIIGYGGNDVMFGFGGDDTIFGGGDDDYVSGGDGDDNLQGNSGNDELYGGAGNDTINGGSSNDVIFGDEGNDEILGGSGNDILLGGAGNDELTGHSGIDALTGGAGSDTFFFLSGSGSDIITDFTDAEDILNFEDFGFSSASSVINAATQVDNDVVIDLGAGDVVTLVNFNIANLDSYDFII